MHETTPLTNDELQLFDRLTEPLDVDLSTLDLALRAVASWRVVVRPNLLAEFNAAAKPCSDGRKYVPPGHVTYMGDFIQPCS